MQITTKYVLYSIDILTLVLILIIIFLPNSIFRVILGLPLFLFFPGYTLIEALFAQNNPFNIIEKVALSFGLSIAVDGLIGIALNYLPWGLTLYPILISIAIFIALMSAIILVRYLLSREEGPAIILNIFSWRDHGFVDKILIIALIVAMVGAIGGSSYVVAKIRLDEKFTEFYMLGLQGQLADYPAVFSGTIIGTNEININSVQYGSDPLAIPDKTGEVTLGIINEEREDSTYTIKMTINDQPAKILFGDIMVNDIGPIQLGSKQKWEYEIGISPVDIGANQEVKLLLYKNNGIEPSSELHLWITAKEGQ